MPEMGYKFMGQGDIGLYNNGFEIRGLWDGVDISLADFLGRCQRQKHALEFLSRNPIGIPPDDIAIINKALRG